MKDFLISTLTGARGRIVTVLTALVVGYATRLLGKQGLEMSPDDATLLGTAIGGAVGWGIDALVLYINAKGVQKIQDALPPHVQTDGYAGPVTVKAVEKAVDQANDNNL